MNMLMALTLTLIAAPAFADIGGSVHAPIEIKTQDSRGNISNYSGELKWVSNKGKTVWLDNGIRAMCGSSLGQLASDLRIEFVELGGAKRTLTIEKSGPGRKVNVWGGCDQKSSELDQLTIDVELGNAPTVE